MRKDEKENKREKEDRRERERERERERGIGETEKWRLKNLRMSKRAGRY